MTWVWGYGNRRFGRLPVSGGFWCERLCCCCGVSQVKWSEVEPKMHARMPFHSKKGMGRWVAPLSGTEIGA